MRLYGLEVDYELELGEQHDWKIARLLALENQREPAGQAGLSLTGLQTQPHAKPGRLRWRCARYGLRKLKKKNSLPCRHSPL
jgi:hypothetical protein